MSAGRSEDELAREALDGLFAIACEDRPAAVRVSLREQIDELDAKRCRALVREMVDTGRLADLVAESQAGSPQRPPTAPQARVEKVDRALEPLVALTCGDEATQRLDEMAEDERLNLLFASLGPPDRR